MTPSEISKWVRAAEARREREGAIPVRYTQGSTVVMEGHLFESIYFSPLSLHQREGIPSDTLLLHLRTSVLDGPIQWLARRLDRTEHTLSGCNPGEDTPAWTLTLLPPGTVLASQFVVGLVHVDEQGVLAIARKDAPERVVFPGGSLDPSDGDPWSTERGPGQIFTEGERTLWRGLAREVREETGIDLSNTPLKKVHRAAFAGRNGLIRTRVLFTVPGELPGVPETQPGEAAVLRLPVEDYLACAKYPALDATVLAEIELSREEEGVETAEASP